MLADGSVCERAHIEWRSILDPLCDSLTSHLASRLHSKCHAALKQDEQSLNKSVPFPHTVVSSEVSDNNPDCPQHILQSTFVVWQEFDRLLPLAKAGSEKPLYALRNAYITALDNILESCASWFDNVMEMSPHHLPMICRYLILSSAGFLCDMTWTFINLLGLDEACKSRLDGRISHLEHLLDKFISAVQHHHSEQLVTSVLHDADSHNWADEKEYFAVRTTFVAL